MTNRFAISAAAALLAAGVGFAAPASAQEPAQVLVGADDSIVGLSAQVAGDVQSSANSQSSYGVVIQATSAMQELSGVAVDLAITQSPLGDSDALARFEADPHGTASRPLTSSPTSAGTTDAGVMRVGVGTVTSVTVPAGGLGLGEEPGVYGVTVDLTIGGVPVWTDAFPLTWRPAALPHLDVAILAPIGGSEERVESLLTAASDPRISLAVDPGSVSITTLANLADREVFALPAGGVDVSSVAHASAAPVLEAALTRSARSTDLPWLAVAGVADDATVQLAQQFHASAVVSDGRWTGLTQDGAHVVANVKPDGARVTPLLISHPALSQALAGSGPANPAGTAEVLAEAAFAATSGADTVLVYPGDSWTVDGTRPSRAAAALLDSAFVTPVTVTDLLIRQGRPTLDLPTTAPSTTDASPSDVSAVANVLGRLDTLEAAADERSDEIDAARQALFTSLQLSARLDPMHRSQAITEALSEAREVLDAVAVTSGSSVLLVSSSGDVPITVSNALDVPVTVKVVLRSRSPILATKAPAVVTVPARSEATVTVPVSAISSGDAAVSVALRTEDDQTLAVAEMLNVRVRAAWGSTATGVFTAGLAVLLLGGVWRTVKRGRKDTRTGPADESQVAGATQS